MNKVIRLSFFTVRVLNLFSVHGNIKAISWYIKFILLAFNFSNVYHLFDNGFLHSTYRFLFSYHIYLNSLSFSKIYLSEFIFFLTCSLVLYLFKKSTWKLTYTINKFLREVFIYLSRILLNFIFIYFYNSMKMQVESLE